MLSLRPKLNKPIWILDKNSGTKWSLWLYYDRNGEPLLAFDMPASVRVDLYGRKEASHDRD